MNIRLWADANQPVYHIEIKSPRPLAVAALQESWKRLDGGVQNQVPAESRLPQDQIPQDVTLERNGAILGYYAVGDHSVHAADLKYYEIETDAAKSPDLFRDPFRFNTFGYLLKSPDLKLKDGVLSGNGEVFDIRIHALTMQTPNAESWIAAIERQAARKLDTAADWKQHCGWWTKFWDRSWINVHDTTVPVSHRGKLEGEAENGKRNELDGAALVSHQGDGVGALGA